MNGFDTAKPLYTLTVGEFFQMMEDFVKRAADGSKDTTSAEADKPTGRLVYGLAGIGELFHVSHKTAQYYKDHVISVSIPSKSSNPSVPSDAKSEGITHTIPSATPTEGMEGTEETEGPTITDTLPYPLPDFLQKVIARTLLEHIIGVYNTLPHVSTPIKAPADARTFSKQKFWSDLPPQFDTQTFLQTASVLAIAPTPRNTSPPGAKVGSW